MNVSFQHRFGGVQDGIGDKKIMRFFWLCMTLEGKYSSIASTGHVRFFSVSCRIERALLGIYVSESYTESKNTRRNALFWL